MLYMIAPTTYNMIPSYGVSETLVCKQIGNGQCCVFKIPGNKYCYKANLSKIISLFHDKG